MNGAEAIRRLAVSVKWTGDIIGAALLLGCLDLWWAVTPASQAVHKYFFDMAVIGVKSGEPLGLLIIRTSDTFWLAGLLLALIVVSGGRLVAWILRGLIEAETTPGTPDA